jgi:hypothetical protein
VLAAASLWGLEVDHPGDDRRMMDHRTHRFTRVDASDESAN